EPEPPARRRCVADDLGELHPDASHGRRSPAIRRGAALLPVGAERGPATRARARLRPASGSRRREEPGGVGERARRIRPVGAEGRTLSLRAADGGLPAALVAVARPSTMDGVIDVAAYPPRSAPARDGRSRSRRFAAQDRAFGMVTGFFAALVTIALAGILVALAVAAWPALRAFGPGFLVGTTWSPADDVYGALVAGYGTIVTSAIALLIAVPVSFGIAVFLTETCPAGLARPLGIAIELLAGIPSIIYGFWGLFVLAPVVQAHVQPLLAATGLPVFAGPPLGIGIFTAGVVLALMVVPFVASVMRDVFETVPPMLKESAYG